MTREVVDYLGAINKSISNTLRLHGPIGHTEDLIYEALDYTKFLTRVCQAHEYEEIIVYIRTWESLLNLYFRKNHHKMISRPLGKSEEDDLYKKLDSYWASILADLGIQGLHHTSSPKSMTIYTSAFQDTILPLVFTSVFKHLGVPLNIKLIKWHEHLNHLVNDKDSIGSIQNLNPIYEDLILARMQKQQPRLVFSKVLFACGGQSVYLSLERFRKIGIAESKLSSLIDGGNISISNAEMSKLFHRVTATVESYTDHEAKLRSVLGANNIDEYTLIYRNNMDGLRLLLDGEVDMYCGGLSNEYPLLSSFLSSRLVSLSRINMDSGVGGRPNFNGLVTRREVLTREGTKLSDITYAWFAMIKLLRELIKRHQDGDTLAKYSLEKIVRMLNGENVGGFIDVRNLIDIYQFDSMETLELKYDNFFTDEDSINITKDDLRISWDDLKAIYSEKEFGEFKKSLSPDEKKNVYIKNSTYHSSLETLTDIEVDEVINPNIGLS